MVMSAPRDRHRRRLQPCLILSRKIKGPKGPRRRRQLLIPPSLEIADLPIRPRDRVPKLLYLVVESVNRTEQVDVGSGLGSGSGKAGVGRTLVFRKKVNLNSLAIYWQPREKNIFSEQSYSAEREEVRDIQFSSKISRQNSTCKGLNYLLGPIHMQAEMNWCPEPKKSDFRWRSCGST